MRMIDADALKERFKGWGDELMDGIVFEEFAEDTIIPIIDEQPTLDVVPTDYHDKCMKVEIEKRMALEPKHGRWIKHNHYVECLLCHRTWNSDYNDTYAFNYCPNCGARMDEKHED